MCECGDCLTFHREPSVLFNTARLGYGADVVCVQKLVKAMQYLLSTCSFGCVF